jgi:hypothetical protein
LHEEKFAEWLAIPLHLFESAWAKPFALEADVLGRNVVNNEGNMAVPIAEFMGLRSVVIHCQFARVCR